MSSRRSGTPSLRVSKAQVIGWLNTVLEDDTALLRERMAALRILLRWDRENTISKLERMYENSAGVAKIQVAEMLLKVIKGIGESDILEDE